MNGSCVNIAFLQSNCKNAIQRKNKRKIKALSSSGLGHRTLNPGIAGSNPVRASILFYFWLSLPDFRVVGVRKTEH